MGWGLDHTSGLMAVKRGRVLWGIKATADESKHLRLEKYRSSKELPKYCDKVIVLSYYRPLDF